MGGSGGVFVCAIDDVHNAKRLQDNFSRSRNTDQASNPLFTQRGEGGTVA